MVDLNKVILIGRLTRDPELRTTQGGTQIAKLAMAVNRRRTVNGEAQEETCFVDLTAFGRQAEVIGQYLAKGRQLFVEGRLSFSTWQAQDGGKRSKLEVIVERFQFMGDRDREGGSGGRGQRTDTSYEPQRGSEEGGSQLSSGASDGFGDGQGFGEQANEGEIPF